MLNKTIVGFTRNVIRVLLVDYDENYLTLYKTLLENKGYIVETAQTGKQAIHKANNVRGNNAKFNVAIINITLPDGMGDGVAKAIREKDDQIRLLLKTEPSSFQRCINALDIGIEVILLEPISPDELNRSVEAALQHTRQRARGISCAEFTQYSYRLLRKIFIHALDDRPENVFPVFPLIKIRRVNSMMPTLASSISPGENALIHHPVEEEDDGSPGDRLALSKPLIHGPPGRGGGGSLFSLLPDVSQSQLLVFPEGLPETYHGWIDF